MGVIEVEVPEGIPLKPLKKKIEELVKEEEARWVLFERAVEELNLTEAELEDLETVREKVWKEERKKILDKCCGIIKLDRPLSLKEMLDPGNDT